MCHFNLLESRCGKAKNGQKLLKNSYTKILKYYKKFIYRTMMNIIKLII